MNRLIYESRDPDPTILLLDDLPGGPEAFELASKFCYGVPVDLTATNISGLRCAAEYLEMTEDLEEGNLIFKTEAFLSYVVLSSWRDSILVLKSCEKLSPWAENLQIVRRCSESIAWKACSNPKGIKWAYTGKSPSPSTANNFASSSPKWKDPKDSGFYSSPSRNNNNNNQPVPPDWWFEDVSILRIDHFVRVITAIKVLSILIFQAFFTNIIIINQCWPFEFSVGSGYSVFELFGLGCPKPVYEYDIFASEFREMLGWVSVFYKTQSKTIWFRFKNLKNIIFF